ncbi:hypothetical protein M405DRAFT_827657 [Rhizopogon salebrosus TDB-379]|nr:hypothetical protein M405DRAFT_827657 [Rhizopogon salebrosus TDB-379]
MTLPSICQQFCIPHSATVIQTFNISSPLSYSVKNATSFRRCPYSIVNQAIAIPGRPVLITQYKYDPNYNGMEQ